jgi:tetratricopeptide (TPR) repeat protein
MSKRRLILLLIATFVIIGISYLRLITNRGLASSASDNAIDLDSPLPDTMIKSTAQLIHFWRSRSEQNPNDFISLTYLGQTFMRQGRETGDVSAYERAEAAFNTALTIDPQYESAIAYLSADHFVKHEFRDALDLAQRVYSNDPRALQALATVGDAQLELGNYTEAEAAYRQLLERSSTPSVYSRLARLSWLQGHFDAALKQMQQAVAGAASMGLTGESAAWYEYQLAELYFNAGQFDAAAQYYQAALDSFNNYYLGLAGLGKVSAAQGKYDQAISYYERAVAIIPQPDFLAALGDLYQFTGQPINAKHEYDTVEYIGKLAKINQQVYNRQLANFYSDHNIHLTEALKLATTELESRKDIYGYDAAAWAYYKNGLLDQAQATIDQALKLGTRDAKLYYHAGLIAEAQGRASEAQRLLSQTLAINPHFDLIQARVAQAALDELLVSSK